MIHHAIAALLSMVHFVPTPCGTAPATSIHGTVSLFSKDGHRSGPVVSFVGTDVRLAPGLYAGGLDSGECHSSNVFVVLRNAPRTVEAHMRAGFWATTRDDAIGLAGFVPRGVVRVQLDPADAFGRSYVHVVRGGAYYFDDEGGFGRFILSLTDASGATSRIPIDMNGLHWSVMRRDVTLGELAASRGVESPFRRPGLLARGLGDAMWVFDTLGNRVELLRPGGAVSSFPLPSFDSVPTSIAVDRSGNAWLTESRTDAIARISPAGVVREFRLPPTLTSGDPFLGGRVVPEQIVLGPDGRMWCRMRLRPTIAAIGPDGTMSLFDIKPLAGPRHTSIGTIAAGTDGRVWFGGTVLGSIGADGTIEELQNDAGVYAILPADDGLWLSTWDDAIVKLAFDGSTRTYPIPLGRSAPYAMAVGGDGSLSFADRTGNVIGTVSKAKGVAMEYAMGVPAGIVSFSAGVSGDMAYAMPAQHTIVTGRSLVFVAGDPTYLERDGLGNIWFSEPNANAVGYVEPSGHVRLFPLPKP